MRRVLDRRCTKKELIVAIIIIAIRFSFFSMLTLYTLSGDSAEYIEVSSLNILKGNLHARRVPVYCFILDAVKYVCNIVTNSEDFYLFVVVIIQMLFSYVSVYLIYDTLKMFITNRNICLGIVLLYGISPSVIGWDKIILTESLALSGTVVFIWLLAKYLKQPNTKIGLSVNILTVVLIFLRPTFLINYCVLFVFWLIRFVMYKSERSILRYNLICSLGIGIFILGYAGKFYSQYEIFTLSATKVQQDCITVVQQSLWGKNTEDIDVIAAIIENNSFEDENGCINAARKVLESYSFQRVEKFVSNSIKTDFVGYMSHKLRTIFLLGDIEIANNVWYGKNVYSARTMYYEGDLPLYSIKNTDEMRKMVNIYRNIIPEPCFIHIYIVALAEIINVIWGGLKKKDVWFHLGLASFMTLIVLSSVWGTCGEWGRTAICVLPYFYISCGLCIQWLYDRIKNKILAEKEL